MDQPTNLNMVKGASEVDIDTVNQWLRSQPEYQQMLQSWGVDPNNIHLNDEQKRQVMQFAQSRGVKVDEGNMEVDPTGNLNPKGHKLRNTLIVAGLAGAAIAAPYAIGALSSMGGGAGAAAGATEAAGAGAAAGGAALPASTIGLAGSGLAGSAGGIGATAVGSGLAAGGTLASTAAPIAGMMPAGLSTGASAGLIGGAGSLGSAGSAALPFVQGANSTSKLGAIAQMLGKKGANNIVEGDQPTDPYHQDPKLGDFGDYLGAYAHMQAGNRATTGEFTQGWDRLNLQATQDRRLAEADALKKLAQTGYLASGGSPYKPAMIGGAALPSFGFGPKAPSAAQQQAANTLESQLLARLQPGAGWKPSPLESYTKEGKGEKAANWGALALKGLGYASKFF